MRAEAGVAASGERTAVLFVLLCAAVCLCVCAPACTQAALLAGRTNKALVGREEFSQAVLRSVAGIEKKRSILQGIEKEVVARHEVRGGFAVGEWIQGFSVVLCLCSCVVLLPWWPSF